MRDFVIFRKSGYINLTNQDLLGKEVMWRLDNNTEFPVESMFYFDKEKQSKWVIIIKLTGSINSKNIKLAEIQKPVNIIDIYQDDNPQRALMYGSDLVPAKEFTDIILNGFAYCPNDVETGYIARISLGDFEKSIIIRNSRYYKKGFFNIKILEDDFEEKVSLSYDNAFGGRYLFEDVEKIFMANPAGKGFTCSQKIEEDIVYLPILEYPDQPCRNWKKEVQPASFGYIPGNWEPRKTQAGNYSDQWFKEKYPFYPDDFSRKFWQQAAADQQYQGEFFGKEKLILTNMTKGGSQINTLPENQELYPFEIKSRIKGKSSIHKYKINTLLIEPEDMTISTVYATEIAYDPDTDGDIVVTINQLTEKSKKC